MKTAAAAGLALLTAAAAAAAAPSGSLLSLVASDPRLSELHAAVVAAGMEDELADSTTASRKTLFAPVNGAFSRAWSEPRLKYLFADPDRLARAVRHHVVDAVVSSDTYARHTEGVLEADVPASNGVLHVVDAALPLPQGTVCPDTVFASIGSKYERIVAKMGYDGRGETGTFTLADEKATKPLAVATADGYGLDGGTVFWTNDMDYPHGSATSWASAATYQGRGKHHVIDKLIDPQGMTVDNGNKKLYFAEHSGYMISRTALDGTGKEIVVHKAQNESFQPSDVAVDSKTGKMFVSVLQPDSVGYVAEFDLTASDVQGTETVVAGPNVTNPYGVCLDDYNKHLFYIVGGHGGQIRCHAYGATACKVDVVADIVDYATSCDVDNSLAPHGGPTNIVFTMADDIYYVSSAGGDYGKLDRANITQPLAAPLGAAFGCSGRP